MATRGIIFDFGGVFNRQHEALRGFERAAQRFGRAPRELYDLLYSCEEWQRAKLGQMRAEHYWRCMMGRLGLPVDGDVQAFHAALFEGDLIDRQVVALAELLRQRYPLALLSNALDDLEQLLAGPYQLAYLFTLVVNSATAGVAKPEPRAYQLALEGLGLAPHETLFIDDKPRNVEAGRALGIPSILYSDAPALAGALVERGLISPQERAALGF